MKKVKVGHHVEVLIGDRYYHAQVTQVTNQTAIRVSIKGAADHAATRLTSPGWSVNRFGY